MAQKENLNPSYITLETPKKKQHRKVEIKRRKKTIQMLLKGKQEQQSELN